jgi:ParB family protein of integrating conjugative element (PFGI_1 class)
MNKRRPTDDQLAEMLIQPHFGQPRGEIRSMDPITTTPMILEIDRIDFYDRNPRRSPNDKFHEIKSSMAASEMDQPLTITRRPGAPNYMVFKGGNTRLKAVKELYSETGEERFYRIHCLFQPWTKESDALLGHLKENDLRGDLTFLDRALAIREMRLLLEEEIGDTFSQRKLSEVLKDRGYSVSHTLIQWFDYVVDHMHQAIPTTLKAGAGRPLIERIKTLDRTFSKCWQSLELGADNMAQDVFIEVLSRHDAEQLDLDAIRRDLETELSVTADLDLQRVSLLFGAALDGRHPNESSTVTVSERHDSKWSGNDDNPSLPPDNAIKSGQKDAQESNGHTKQTSQSTGNDDESESQAKTPATKTATGDDRRPTETNLTTPSPQPSEETSTEVSITVGRYKDATNPVIFEDPIPLKPTQGDLPILRERAWALARGIAVMARLGPEIIHSIPTGIGYLIGPAPYEIIAQAEQQLGPQHINHLRHLWWVLAGISEQFMPGNSAIEHLPDDWRNRPMEEGIAIGRDGHEPDFMKWHMGAMELFGTDQEPRAEAMWQEMPPAAINWHGALLWPRMDEYAWRSLAKLIDVYRAVRRASNDKVWG